MDWFERLTGFRENGYADTRRRLDVIGQRLLSAVNGKSYGIGELELASLQSLRERAQSGGGLPGRLKVSIVSGDVRGLHRLPEHAGALFQVASQFNLLEMISPNVSPEDGVTRYERDSTQGPACALAAGAATIFRNYFARVGDQIGQTSACQLDGLADVKVALSAGTGQPAEALWAMRNGYALCTRPGLDAIAEYLASSGPCEIDALRGKLRIGVHRDVEVTDGDEQPGPIVSQAFCSALPVAYSEVRSLHWAPFASLVLETAYEATMWAAVIHAQRTASNVVLLARLGGGAFGNDDAWIESAVRRALRLVQGFALDVRLVSYGAPSQEMIQLAEDFA